MLGVRLVAIQSDWHQNTTPALSRKKKPLGSNRALRGPSGLSMACPRIPFFATWHQVPSARHLLAAQRRHRMGSGRFPGRQAAGEQGCRQKKQGAE